MTNLLEKPELNLELNGVEESGLTFADFTLPPFLREGLNRLGFTRPTEIQAQSIPTLLAGHDLVGQSHTGSGKTAAYAIPLLARVQRQSRDMQALVLVPTRELALQVTQVIKSLAGMAVRITTIYGGAGMEGQVRSLTRYGAQVVIGTPGRVRDHLNRGTLRLDKLRMLVLDEADEMLDRGFAVDVEAIIQAAGNAPRQTALFSATLPEWVMDTARKHLRPDYDSITLEPTPESHPDIEHLVYEMKPADKGVALRHLLDTHDRQSILVFARTKHGVKKLADRLEDEGYSVAGLQGNLSQRAREEVMRAFRANKVRIMVATNVGARGLDVSGVSHVINYDLPESAELFTHRVGRTGRNGASGTAITFLTGEDRPKWREIERAMRLRGITLDRQPWYGPRAEVTNEPSRVVPFERNYNRNSAPAGEREFYGRRQERSFSDRPARNFEDRPARNFEDRPARSYDRYSDGNSRGFEDRPYRKGNDSGRRNDGQRSNDGWRGQNSGQDRRAEGERSWQKRSGQFEGSEQPGQPFKGVSRQGEERNFERTGKFNRFDKPARPYGPRKPFESR